MNAIKVLAGEFVIVIALDSWNAIHNGGYLPLPSIIARSCLGFAVLGIISLVSPELAAALGAGYVVANYMKTYKFFTGKPSDYFMTSNAPTMDIYSNEWLRVGGNQSTPNSSNPLHTPNNKVQGA